jgi:hypothetical protein
MTRAGRAGVDAVEGTLAAGHVTGGQRAAGSTKASGNNAGKIGNAGRKDPEGGSRHHRDRPSQAPVTPRGYRSSTDWTVVYGHASAIPAPPPQAAGVDDDRPQRRIDGVVPRPRRHLFGAGAPSCSAPAPHDAGPARIAYSSTEGFVKAPQPVSPGTNPEHHDSHNRDPHRAAPAAVQEESDATPSGTLDDRLEDEDYPAYSMGRAAELLGVTPTFLRSLDAAKLFVPQRSAGGHRRYSRYQLRLAQRARDLIDQGTALEAACRIIILEDQLAEANCINAQLQQRLDRSPASPPTAT